MMKPIISIEFIILLSVVCCRAMDYNGFTVYDIFPTKEQEHLLKPLFVLPGFDVWRTGLGQRLTVMVDPSLKREFLDHLRKNGIRHSVYIENVARNVAVSRSSDLWHSHSLPPDPFSAYLSHEQMNDYLELLAEKYPNFVHVQTFGSSFEKRQLHMVKISSKESDREKPIILIDGGIHGREWIAPAMALSIIYQLVENKTNRYLTEDIEWHICPLLNPDGYEYSRNTDMLWRKTRSITRNKNCRGVDPNRNFNFHWKDCGSSSDPCSSTYAGEEPFSEMETQALRDYVLSIKNQLKLYLTFHSYGPYILYPWGYTNDLPDNVDELQSIAAYANAAQMRAGGPEYLVGSSENLLYCASGGSDDWVMAIANVSLVFTIEMPPGKIKPFHPPAKDIPKLVTSCFEAVRTFGHHIAGYGHCGSLGKCHTNSAIDTERNLLKDIIYLHTMCLVAIQFIGLLL